jgi:Mrp family chromosome partitioning ATPase
VGEILSDRESGLFVPAADSQALAAAIEELIEDPGLAQRLGEKARDNCYTNYSAAAAIERLEKTYGKLMRNKRPENGALEHTFQQLSAGGAAPAARNGKNAANTELNDRRSYERVRGRFPVEVELASGERFTAYTTNLSEAGMKLEYTDGVSGELIQQGDMVKVVLNSPFLAAKSVRVIEDFEVLACEPWDGTTWQVRLQSAASRDGLSTELTGLRPYEFVMPEELEDTFLQAQAQMNLNLPDSDTKMLVFSAAESGAGNSTISWWFAVCLARTPQRRVLFIDGNVHARNNAPGNPPIAGFVDLLLGQETLENTIMPMGVGAPHLLNVGRVGRFTSGELSPSQVSATFDLLREHYDYVVIDAPPAAVSPLTMLWAQAADGCMVVLESGKSQREAAEATVSRLRQSGVRVLGAMLNKH